jgi:hypothetical protein
MPGLLKNEYKVTSITPYAWIIGNYKLRVSMAGFGTVPDRDLFIQLTRALRYDVTPER